jgi:hypothetical protein
VNHVRSRKKLGEFENCISRFNKADEIIFTLLISNERGMPNCNDLVKVGGNVHELHDEVLLRLYNRILQEMGSSSLYPKFHPNDYFAFIQRLGMLLNEAIIQANEADIALREVIGLQSDSGLLGGKGWCPSGQLQKGAVISSRAKGNRMWYKLDTRL